MKRIYAVLLVLCMVTIQLWFGVTLLDITKTIENLNVENNSLREELNILDIDNSFLKGKIIDLEEVIAYQNEVINNQWIECELTSNSSFKSYMDGSKITDRTSKAYELKETLKVENGLYKDGDFIAIAISNHYGNVGDRFKITLSSGNVFYAIMCDTKKEHELNEKKEHPDTSLIEFIIDIDEAKKHYKQCIINGSFNYDDQFKGNIIKIERWNNDV